MTMTENSTTTGGGQRFPVPNALHVGRVGALAIVLGVGIAIFSLPAVAIADVAGSEGSASTGDLGPTRGDGGASAHVARPRPAASRSLNGGSASTKGATEAWQPP